MHGRAVAIWATSAAFDLALQADSRQWNTQIEIVYQGDVVLASDVILSGYIQMDNVAVRRELHVTFVDADGVLTPATTRDLLSPKGTELRVKRGLYIPSLDDYEYVPLGVFGLVKPEVRSHSDGVVLECKGFDRVDAVRARRFTQPWVIAKGTLVTQAIADIVASRIPNIPVKITPSVFTTPEMVFDRLDSPWDAVRTLASAAGLYAYFDGLGSLVIEPAVGRETGVTYTIGTEVATLMNVSRSMDSDETYSGIQVTGENPDQTTFRVEKWDMDPTSPTYSEGPFGRRPYGYFSELITTLAQAQAKVDELFPQKVRIAEEVEIYTVGTLGHDIDDVFTVVDPRSKTNGKYQIVSGTIPLRVSQGDNLRWRCKVAGT